MCICLVPKQNDIELEWTFNCNNFRCMMDVKVVMCSWCNFCLGHIFLPSCVFDFWHPPTQAACWFWALIQSHNQQIGGHIQHKHPALIPYHQLKPKPKPKKTPDQHTCANMEKVLRVDYRSIPGNPVCKGETLRCQGCDC